MILSRERARKESVEGEIDGDGGGDGDERGRERGRWSDDGDAMQVASRSEQPSSVLRGGKQATQPTLANPATPQLRISCLGTRRRQRVTVTSSRIANHRVARVGNPIIT